MRKLWRIMKLFRMPVNDDRVQSLTEEQIDFMIWSDILDDPEKVRKLDDYFYDPDYDKDFEEAMEEAAADGDYYEEDSFDNELENADKDEIILARAESIEDVDDWEDV